MKLIPESKRHTCWQSKVSIGIFNIEGKEINLCIAFQGAGASVFDSKYSTLKKSDLLWEKPEPEAAVAPSASSSSAGGSASDKHSCGNKTPSSGRILTKGNDHILIWQAL